MRESAGGGVTATTSRSQSSDQVDISTEAVNLMVAENGAKAGIKVLQTAQEMQKSILDILA